MASVYLHFEGDDADMTMKAKTEVSLAEALAKFSAKFAKKCPSASPLASLEAKSEGMVLSESTWSTLRNKSDVFVSRASGAAAASEAPPPPPAKKVEAPKAAPAVAPAGKAAAAPAAKAAPKPAPAPAAAAAAARASPTFESEQAEASRLVKSLLKKAAMQVGQKALRNAKTLYEAILEAAPGNRDASRGLATIRFHAGDYDGACDGFSALMDGVLEARDAYMLGQAHHKLQRFGLAQKAYRTSLRSLTAAQAEYCGEAEVTVALARSLLSGGDQEEACALCEKVLGQNQYDVGAVCCYAAIAHEMGKHEEELQLLLRAVVQKQTDPVARAALAAALGARRGVDRLRRQLGENAESSAAAVAFLATICKDFGYVEVAVDLLAWAAADQPDSASYALNLVHAHEILNDYESAVAVAVGFATRRAGSRLGTRGATFADVLKVVDGCGAFGSAAFLGGPEGVELEWVEKKGPDPKVCDSYVKVRGAAEVPLDKETLSDEDLDALALLFALVKILYLGGAVGRATALVAVLERTRRNATKPLHETTIRNEHAYYCCVSQILAVDPRAPPPPYTAALGKDKDGPSDVYVVGDSHSLAPAWKLLDLGDGRRARLRPALVTGCKHWHLRTEGTFYPKRNYYAVVGVNSANASSSQVAKDLGLFKHPGGATKKPPKVPAATVPPGADVLFCLGEIDCREGILLAVEKLRYDDVDQGIRETCGIFVQKAALLCRERKYRRALVHPVAPVLNETRAMVLKYNKVLKALVDKTPELTWLDFFDGFLDADGGLNPAFALDGTHLHPKYLDDLLAPKLAAALAA